MNWEENDWVQLLLMAKFAYNNSKNTNINHTFFKLNCSYHPQIFFKNKYNIYFRSFSANKLATKLKKLMNIYCQNFLYAQDL